MSKNNFLNLRTMVDRVCPSSVSEQLKYYFTIDWIRFWIDICQSNFSWKKDFNLFPNGLQNGLSLSVLSWLFDLGFWRPILSQTKIESFHLNSIAEIRMHSRWWLIVIFKLKIRLNTLICGRKSGWFILRSTSVIVEITLPKVTSEF